jgi:transposase InsO family protein
VKLGPDQRVYVSGATSHPDSAWVTQKARNLTIEERLEGVRFLLHDRDAKFSGPSDSVFESEGIRVIRTPIRAPKANAFAERFVRTAKTECLDHMLIYGRRHLERVLGAYVAHYLQERPHRGLGLATPSGRSASARPGPDSVLHQRDILGGLVHEYDWAA